MQVRLDGGLGNQMFQYAYARTMPETTLVNSCWQYGLQLDKLNTKLPVIEEAEAKGSVLSGYWQEEKFFQNIDIKIREEFTLKCAPDPKARGASSYFSNNSVAVHVRRGDYTGPSRNLEIALPLDYYERAIEYLKSTVVNPRFFVFSDDIAWVERNLDLPRMSVLLNFKVHEDLWLMTQCKHSIIANSTLSWWGAWLKSEGGIVVAPAQWFPKGTKFEVTKVPQRWTQL